MKEETERTRKKEEGIVQMIEERHREVNKEIKLTTDISGYKEEIASMLDRHQKETTL